VDLLLDVDREYREKATVGQLIKIAPKRFNPEGEAWLPVLHTARGTWHFTALYSNTAQAHQLARVTGWVVIFFHEDSQAEGQRTVVTEPRGEAAGRRIVRGREPKCLRHYALTRVGSPESSNGDQQAIRAGGHKDPGHRGAPRIPSRELL
jgi:putative hydrolase